MAYVVTERCVDCRYTDCCAVCPVDCFLETKDPAMLVIDPATCIDCGLCIPECPIYAIYPLAEVPEPYKEWIQKNADLVAKGTTITEQTEALPTAISLEEIHAREKSRGWDVKDPSAVAEDDGGGAAAPTPAAAAPTPAAAARAPVATATPGEGRERVRVPKAPKRPLLDVRVGGRVRIFHRVGVVQEMRTRTGGDYADVRVMLEGDPRPTWYLYSSLQTFRDKGDFEVLEPGPDRGLLAKIFGT